ncbi:hypothetical protein BUE93_20215 [Chromobacterium amazonense]|uniref:DUF1496 domain-containing protein n=1 Tax=Chromobacterium amazonense TaxID=1382803 RepID=A0A2S9WZF1_9NEIS|nr:hypothetical protein [Chromobacterium amazonense]PRP68776.1 hypothetical protein BUE93_20215 [Chromobacterium amazonense]
MKTEARTFITVEMNAQRERNILCAGLSLGLLAGILLMVCSPPSVQAGERAELCYHQGAGYSEGAILPHAKQNVRCTAVMAPEAGGQVGKRAAAWVPLTADTLEAFASLLEPEDDTLPPGETPEPL